MIWGDTVFHFFFVIKVLYKTFYRKSIDLIWGNCVHLIAFIIGVGMRINYFSTTQPEKR